MTTVWLGSATFVSSVALTLASGASQELPGGSGESQGQFRALLQQQHSVILHGDAPVVLGLWVWPALCLGVIIVPVALVVAGSYAVSRLRRHDVLQRV